MRALKHRSEETGYEPRARSLDCLLQRLPRCGRQEEAVYDEDLEALVNERDREECAIYTLEGVQVSCGFPEAHGSR